MTLDPSIILRGQPQVKQFEPVEAAEKIMTMKRLARQDQLLEKQSSAQDEDRQMKKQMQTLDLTARLAGSATDQASYDQALKAASEYGLDTAKLPPIYDPQLMKTYQGMALSAKEKLAQQNTERDMRFKEADLALRGRALNAKTPSNGQRLPADKVLLVNEGNSIPEQLVEIENTISNNQGSFGPLLGRAGSANPWDVKSQTINSQISASSQAFGRFMEGGVLRKEDEAKYRKMFPNLEDAPDVAKNKLAIVNKLLVDRQTSNINALAQSGYDVDGLRRPLKPGQLPSILEGDGSKPYTGLGFSKANASAPKIDRQTLDGLSDEQILQMHNKLSGGK